MDITNVPRIENVMFSFLFRKLASETLLSILVRIFKGLSSRRIEPTAPALLRVGGGASILIYTGRLDSILEHGDLDGMPFKLDRPSGG